MNHRIASSRGKDVFIDIDNLKAILTSSAIYFSQKEQ